MIFLGIVFDDFLRVRIPCHVCSIMVGLRYLHTSQFLVGGQRGHPYVVKEYQRFQRHFHRGPLSSFANLFGARNLIILVLITYLRLCAVKPVVVIPIFIIKVSRLINLRRIPAWRAIRHITSGSVWTLAMLHHMNFDSG